MSLADDLSRLTEGTAPEQLWPDLNDHPIAKAADFAADPARGSLADESSQPLQGAVSPGQFRREPLVAGHQRVSEAVTADPPHPTLPRPRKASDFAREMMEPVPGSAPTGKMQGQPQPVSPEEALGLTGPRGELHVARPADRSSMDTHPDSDLTELEPQIDTSPSLGADVVKAAPIPASAFFGTQPRRSGVIPASEFFKEQSHQR